MRIERLELRGILRFSDRVALDLRDLPAGLIALVGPIGEGKSTILEAVPATLYRRWPSRDERELYDYAHDRDSYLEATIALDGRGLYRARVNVDGVRRASEAVLVHIGPDGTQTVLTDGKVTSYSAKVREVFPDQALLLASAFASQNKAGNFISLDRKGRKELFSTLLGLDNYEAMAQTARTAAGLVEAGRGRLGAVRDLLARETGPELWAILEERSVVVRNELAGVNEERVALDASICAREEERVGLKADVEKHHAAAAQCNALAGQIEWRTRAVKDTEAARDRLNTELVEEWRRIDNALEQTLKDLRRREADGSWHEREIETIDGRLRLALQDIDRRLANNRGLLNEAKAIRAAAEKVKDLDAQIAALRAKDADLAKAVGGMQIEWERLLGESHAVDLAKGKLDHAQTSTGLLGTVPCGGEQKFSGCQFLRNAIAAKERIPALQAEVESGAELLEARRQVDADLVTVKEERAHVDGQIFLLTEDLAHAAAVAKKLPALQAAEARIAELTAQRAALEASAVEQRTAAEQREKQRREDLQAQMVAARDASLDLRREAKERENKRRLELTQQIAVHQDELAILKGQIAEAVTARDATAGAVARMAVLDQELTTARRRWDETTAIVARLEAEAADLERRRKALEQRRAELDDVDVRLRALEAELFEWQLLAKALGRDGLPTLEIANAGPTVSAYCNDLLLTCFGPRFTVEIITQEAKLSRGKAGDGMKETFSVLITDNERGGGARDIGDLSGGEKTIVSEALANAIALTVNARSQAPIRTCWRDETTGALDPDMVPRYIEMLRRVQEIGGYERIYFVTHSPLAAELADAQMRFGGGHVEIVLPPFQAAA